MVWFIVESAIIFTQDSNFKSILNKFTLHITLRLKEKPVPRKIRPSSCSSVQRARKSSGASDQLSTHLACCLLRQSRDPLGPLAHPHRHLRHLLLLISHFHQSTVSSKGVVSVWWPQVRWPLWWQLAAGAGRALCLVPSLATNLRLLRTRGERHASSSLGNLLKRCSPRIICGRVNHNRALLGTKPTLCGFKDRHQF